MSVIGFRGKAASSEVQFFRSYDLVTNGDFDGTAVTDPTLLGPDGRNWFGEGFYFQPSQTGDVVALSYQDYISNNKVIDDSLAQTLYSCAAGMFHATRIVKIYDAGTVSATVTIGV